MKLRMLTAVGACAFGFTFAAPSALAANDCCWDWAPTQPGVDDIGEIQPKDDPASPWAQCTKTPAGGGPPAIPGNPCFSRDGRQMIWFNWTCIIGAPAPPPGGNLSNPQAGFACAPKSPGSPGNQPKIGPPPVIVGLVTATEGPLAIPTISEWGLIVLGLLTITGGTIIIRRARSVAPVTV